MSEVKDKVKELLNKVNRPGMKELMDFLEKSDYYEAPASTKYHGAYKCGLIEHSYKVYEILKGKIEYHKLDVSEETLILVTLLHDLCKVNFYKTDYRNAKNAKGEWEKVPYYNTLWPWRKISNDDYRIHKINKRRKVRNSLAYGLFRAKGTICNTRSSF